MRIVVVAIVWRIVGRVKEEVVVPVAIFAVAIARSGGRRGSCGLLFGGGRCCGGRGRRLHHYQRFGTRGFGHHHCLCRCPTI